MKTLYLVMMIIVVFGNSVVFAQTNESGPALSTLQQQLGAYYIPKEKHDEAEKQAKDISDTVFLSEVGIPLAVGVSIGVLLFARKKK